MRSHPKDRAGTCPLCAVRCLQEYLGASIQIDDGVMREATHVRCDGCFKTRVELGAERPDLDGECAGWVLDRRCRADETPPDSAERPTARPPAMMGAA